MLSSGDIIMLCRPARWKNAGADYAVEIPAGAVLRLESKRPEGWMAYVLMTRETVFLFSRYLEHVERVELGRETVIRHAGGVRVDCAQCGAELGCLDARYFHVDRAGGWEVLCPDCAAILALESWGYVDFRRIENAADAIVEWSNN